MVGIGGGAGGGDRTGTEVISVIGLLDSGKSSLIRALLEAVRLRGHTAGVVVNDRGSVELDAEEITRHHPVMQIGGGWIGCSEAGSFAKALKTMAREHRVDYVFAEPSGIVVPFELRNTIASASRDAAVFAGPVLLLLSAADPSAAFHEYVAHVTRQQVTQADLIAVTKLDAPANGGVECLEGSARSLAPETPVHAVSVVSGAGLERLVDVVLGSGR